MRRLVTVLVILVVLAVAWAGGWFALAAWARGQVGAVLAQAAERGVEVDCAERDVVGFPFALRIACGGTAVAEQRSGARAELAGLTGGASIFAPRTARVSLASPAELQSPFLAGPARLRWDSANVDVGMGLNGPQAVSFEAESFSADFSIPDVPAVALSVRSADGRLAPAADGGSDATLAFRQLAVSADGTAFPPFDGEAVVWLSAPPRALLSGRAGIQAPIAARAVNVILSSGAARLQVTGDVSVDAEGIVDGEVTLRVAGSEDLPAFIAALPPERQKIGNAVAGALLAFGQPATLDGDPASELRLAIVRGRARVGPVEIEVPRLPL